MALTIEKRGKSRSLLPVLATASAGVLVLAGVFVDILTGVGGHPGVQRLTVWLNLAGLLSLPLTIVAYVIVMRSWGGYSPGGFFAAVLLLGLATAGTYVYWAPMYDLFFGPWA